MFGAGDPYNTTLADELLVPADLPPGEWVLGIRWDCEKSAQARDALCCPSHSSLLPVAHSAPTSLLVPCPLQVWQNCADLTIV